MLKGLRPYGTKGDDQMVLMSRENSESFFRVKAELQN